MKCALYTAAVFIGLCSATAFAQGGAPYNSSGSQAGGPLAGQERRMGDPGGAPAGDAMASRPMKKKPMMKKKRMERSRM